MSTGAAPEGYATVTPYLVVDDPVGLLNFVRTVFGAEERMRMEGPEGGIAHAETVIGDSVVMVGGSTEQWSASPAVLHLYVADCDGTYRRALEADAESVREPQDEFYGDRMAGVRDPNGNTWWLAQRVEEVPEDEMARRAEEWQAQQR
jgi:PhnB protein